MVDRKDAKFGGVAFVENLGRGRMQSGSEKPSACIFYRRWNRLPAANWNDGGGGRSVVEERRKIEMTG